MSAKNDTLGFGFDPSLTANHFYVVIPGTGSSKKVEVFERFRWPGAEESVSDKSDVLKLELSKHKWGILQPEITAEFNARLKKDGRKAGKFVIGGTPVEKLLGKELMVLLWAVEDCDPSVIPTAVRNWKGLMPEERWWLYTMTNASTGAIGEKRGWRKALQYALTENPVKEKEPDETNLFDMYMPE